MVNNYFTEIEKWVAERIKWAQKHSDLEDEYGEETDLMEQELMATELMEAESRREEADSKLEELGFKDWDRLL